MSADEDKPAIWQLRNIESTYWDEYVATRPIYDDSLFNYILDYHKSGSNTFSAALDIGSGSGSTIGPLAKRFGHVVATDNDPVSLAFNEKRHSTLPSGQVTYTLSSGEDLLKHHTPGSLDLITCAETFPLLDTETALSNIYTLLRPSGTLAIWFYGPPFFTEPEYAAKCQPILDSLLDHKFSPVVNGGDETSRARWKRAADGKISWLDYIPFDSSWQRVKRYKWNTQARLSFFTPGACDFPVERTSNIKDREEISEKQDPSFWAVEWDFPMLKRFVKASFPKPRDMVGSDATMEELFTKLAEAMGGTDGPRKLSWPVVLILAEKDSAPSQV